MSSQSNQLRGLTFCLYVFKKKVEQWLLELSASLLAGGVAEFLTRNAFISYVIGGGGIE